MCDCYTARCEGCETEIRVHIGDFSVAREHVYVYCHKLKCRDAAMARLVGLWDTETKETGGEHMVFADGFPDQDAYEGAKPGQAVLILVDMPRGMSTN